MLWRGIMLAVLLFVFFFMISCFKIVGNCNGQFKCALCEATPNTPCSISKRFFKNIIAQLFAIRLSYTTPKCTSLLQLSWEVTWSSSHWSVIRKSFAKFPLSQYLNFNNFKFINFRFSSVFHLFCIITVCIWTNSKITKDCIKQQYIKFKIFYFIPFNLTFFKTKSNNKVIQYWP